MKRALDYSTYVDRILGAWIGKSVGGTIGAPVEGHKLQMDFCLDDCWPAEIMPNDDLDIQVVWLELLQEKGPFITSRDYAQYWQDHCWYNFAEYGSFLYNWQRGIAPPLSGGFNNKWFRESMGCPIRSEIWGVICPGNPELAAHYARQDGQLDHIRTSVYAESFLAAAAAEAFFSTTVEECLDAGLAVIPADSELAEVTREVELLCECAGDWRQAWTDIIRRWGHRDCSKAITNQALLQMALRLGEGDFDQTLLISLNSGWDTDCTAATVGALLGILIGGEAIPAHWKERLGDRLACDVEVAHKTSLLTEFSEDTARVGVEVTLARSPLVEITSAPLVHVRWPEVPEVELNVAYLGAPTLWADRTTDVEVLVENNGGHKQGVLSLTSPEGIRVSPQQVELELAEGESQVVGFTLGRREGAGPLMDKNLFELRWEGEGATLLTFGLAGARQWTLYGPYWDIYDIEQYGEVCPFHNAEVKKNPHLAGCGRAGSHQYAYLTKPYLDEAALLAGPLPEEYPFKLESATDYFDQDDMGGFTGEACYYFTREFVSPFDCDQVLIGGNVGPFVMWVNGEEVYRTEKSTSWTTNEAWIGCKLKAGPNRLVVKAVRLTDDFAFCLWPYRADAFDDKSRGVAYIDDRFGDMV